MKTETTAKHAGSIKMQNPTHEYTAIISKHAATKHA
jgi:hypothetical protein